MKLKVIDQKTANKLADQARRRFQRGLNFQRRRRSFQTKKAKYAAVWILEIAGCVLAAFLLVSAFGTMTIGAEESMEPTICEDNRVLINRCAYLLSNPSPGDVVVFRPAGNVNAQNSIKRIIGTPGDKIVISRGNVYVNGEVFQDSAEVESIQDGGRASSEITLGEGEYFVLGDNRNNSEDSRYDTIGNITKNEIMGKAWFVLSPQNFGLVR